LDRLENLFKIKAELLAILDELINNGVLTYTGFIGSGERPLTLNLKAIRDNMRSVETSTMTPELLISILSTMKINFLTHLEEFKKGNK
jgi:hypothetical protein